LISNGYGAMFSYADAVAPTTAGRLRIRRTLQTSVRRSAADGRISPDEYAH